MCNHKCSRLFRSMTRTSVVVVIFLGLIVFVSSSFNDKDNLVAVAVFFRHGDRSPIFSFPTDKYGNISYWPMGFAQLTKNGIRRQYELGQWFRKRYSKFLSDYYTPNEIYVYSTDTDRTLMSAYASLAGLYPPKGEQKWSNEILWQPIPVHTSSRYCDDIIVEKMKCKKFEKLYEEVESLKEKEFREKHLQLYEYISDKTGWPNLTLNQIKSLRSIIYTYQNYNASFIPDWAENLDQHLMDYLAAVVYQLPTLTNDLKRLRSGPFLSYLINYFDGFVLPSSNTSNPKFLMLSGHDTSGSSILDAMGAFKMRPINFSDTIIWELRKSEDGQDFFINLLYKRGDELEKLSVYNCDFNCKYDMFKKLLQPVTINIENWKKECEN